MDVSSKKSISLRANGDIDVSKWQQSYLMAADIKTQVAECSEIFKDSFEYENVKKKQIQNHIDKIQGKNDE